MQIGQLLHSLSQRRVLLVGDLMLDEYVAGDCSRISPEAPVPIVQFSRARTVPGGAANAAANVAALGGAATLLGLLGDDQGGRDLRKGCDAVGIRLLAIHDGRPTTRKVRVVTQQQQLLRLDYDHPGEIDGATEDRLLAEFSREIAGADIVVISDYAKGLLTARLCREVIAIAHAAGKEVIIDPRPPHAAYYAGCDLLTPNWKEGLGLLGWSDLAATDEAIERVGRELSHRFQCHVVLTLGPRGISFFATDARENFSVAATAREVFDVSGAGDTVVAAFALARAAGMSYRDAVSLANRAAAVVVGKIGTATVTPSELLANADVESQLLERDDLRGLSASLKAGGKRIVTVNGSFDLLHVGHVHILREAKRQGDVVIVGLNSDASVRGYKGPTRPIVPQDQRAAMLLALRDVSYVHIFDEATPVAFLAEVRPDVHVNGVEYGEDCVEAETVRAAGGRLHLVDRIAGPSTTAIAQKL